MKKELQVKQIKLMKYSEYLDFRKQTGDGSVLENLRVHPKRLIWVAEIDASEGTLELPQNNGENRKLKKAKVLKVVDAETGDLVDSDIFEVGS